MQQMLQHFQKTVLEFRFCRRWRSAPSWSRCPVPACD
jgi:hypothetical protein